MHAWIGGTAIVLASILLSTCAQDCPVANCLNCVEGSTTECETCIEGFSSPDSSNLLCEPVCPANDVDCSVKCVDDVTECVTSGCVDVQCACQACIPDCEASSAGLDTSTCTDDCRYDGQCDPDHSCQQAPCGGCHCFLKTPPPKDCCFEENSACFNACAYHLECQSGYLCKPDPSCAGGCICDPGQQPDLDLCSGEPREPGYTALVEGEFQEIPLRVGAFKVRTFGVTKFGREEVVQSLLQILPRYDILLFQDIRDAGGSAFVGLMDRLNSENDNAFAYTISARLGRSSSKEQYAFIYRVATVTIESEYQYPDVEDVFEREPYGIVVVTSSKSGAISGRFGLLGLHTHPDAADVEIDAFVDVYDVFRAQFTLDDVLLLGDFNADCTYVTAPNWPNIRLRTDSRFQWYIDDDADTTITTNTDCAYDRLVAAGWKLQEAIVPNSAAVYRFDIDQSLTDEEAGDVSSQYPVELLIYGSVAPNDVAVSTQACVDGMNGLASHAEIMNAITSLDAQASSEFTVVEDCEGHVTMTAGDLVGVPDAIAVLCHLAETAPDIVPEVLFRTMQTYLEDGLALQDVASFPGVIDENQNPLSVKVVLKPDDTQICVSNKVA